MDRFLFNLSRVLAHTIVYERAQEVPNGIRNDFVNGFGFGLDIASNALAGKPTIPGFTPISLQQAQGQAISGNLNVLPQLENIGSQVNSFNLDQMQSMLKSAIPGYSAITGSASGTIQDLLSGKVPTDVAQTVQASDAARALSGGYSGSALSGTLTARDLGLTSLQLTEGGLSSAQSWLGLMDKLTQPATFDFSSMFVTPTQQFSAMTEERNAQFQHDYVANMNDWQHSLGVAASQDLNDSIGTIMSLIGSFTGGSLGGGKASSGAGTSNMAGSFDSSQMNAAIASGSD